MQIGSGTNPMASYVAFTRIKRAEDLLIFRPFDRELFAQGNLEGPQLLLKVLRGETIDWKAVEDKHMPSHMCAGCDRKHFKHEFSASMWKRQDGQRYCCACEGTLSANGSKKRCNNCGNWASEANFHAEVWRRRDPAFVVCNLCIEKRECRKCQVAKPEWDYNVIEWKKSG